MKILNKIVRIFVFAIIFGLLFPMFASADANNYVWSSVNETGFPIPLCYKHVKVIEYLGEKGQFLNSAEDLFVAKNNYLYVADTLNNRILKLTLDGVTEEVFTGPADRPLYNPKGIYVDDDGDMYVADTGNKRIVHLAPDGTFVEEFTKPESKLLSDDFIFDSSKVYINQTGHLFSIQSQAFFSMDANNNFRGYVGATKVAFDFRRVLIRLFASEEQKVRVAKELPDSYSNFVIDDRGMIYATVINAESRQIRKITPAGKNIYPDAFYGEKTTDFNLNESLPLLVDLTVDKNGIVSALDQVSCKIFQYDQEGNNLVVFGGYGNLKGLFQLPISLVTDNEGRIYVLDQKANNIQVFEPTHFIKLVHQASTLYNNGFYTESRKIWEEVLKIDANYNLAHRGVAKALLKEGKWKESMETYLLANDKAGYSAAFAQYRHSLYRQNFGWVVLGVAIIVAVLYKALTFIKVKIEAVIKNHMGW